MLCITQVNVSALGSAAAGAVVARQLLPLPWPLPLPPPTGAPDGGAGRWALEPDPVPGAAAGRRLERLPTAPPWRSADPLRTGTVAGGGAAAAAAAAEVTAGSSSGAQAAAAFGIAAGAGGEAGAVAAAAADGVLVWEGVDAAAGFAERAVAGGRPVIIRGGGASRGVRQWLQGKTPLKAGKKAGTKAGGHSARTEEGGEIGAALHQVLAGLGEAGAVLPAVKLGLGVPRPGGGPGGPAGERAPAPPPCGHRAAAPPPLHRTGLEEADRRPRRCNWAQPRPGSSTRTRAPSWSGGG